LVEICRFRGAPQLGAAPGPVGCVRMGERLVTAHLEAAGGRAEAEAQSVSFLTTGCVTTTYAYDFRPRPRAGAPTRIEVLPTPCQPSAIS